MPKYTCVNNTARDIQFADPQEPSGKTHACPHNATTVLLIDDPEDATIRAQLDTAVTQFSPDFTYTVLASDVQAELLADYVRYTNPIAAELVSIVAAADAANGAKTIAGQPDFPRKLQVRVVDANSSISAGIATFVGIGPSGEAVTETVSLVGGTATKKTTKAYARVTSITISGLVGAVTGDTFGVGVAADLGLPASKTPGATAFSVYKANVANANEAVGTVDATAGTISPTTPPDASKSYDFWYTYTVSPS